MTITFNDLTEVKEAKDILRHEGYSFPDFTNSLTFAGEAEFKYALDLFFEAGLDINW